MAEEFNLESLHPMETAKYFKLIGDVDMLRMSIEDYSKNNTEDSLALEYLSQSQSIINRLLQFIHIMKNSKD